jgi:hypothetical protein
VRRESWTKDLQAVKTLVDLGEKRVAGDQIAAFSAFFGTHQNRINLDTFVADLSAYGNLRKALDSLYEEIQLQTERCDRLRGYNNSLNQETISLRSSIRSMNKELDLTRDELQRLISRRELVGVELVAKAKEKEIIGNELPNNHLIKDASEVESKNISENKQAREENSNSNEQLSPTRSSVTRSTTVKSAVVVPSRTRRESKSESNKSAESINSE